MSLLKQSLNPDAEMEIKNYSVDRGFLRLDVSLL